MSVLALGWGCYSSVAPVPKFDPISNPGDETSSGGAGDEDACALRYPWEGTGVTAVLPTGGGGAIVISGDRYYRAELDVRAVDAAIPEVGQPTRWGDTGHLSNLWADAPQVEGRHPWDDPGVTAAYVDKGGAPAVIISRFRMWTLNGGTWNSGTVPDDWGYGEAGPPELDGGQVPWLGDGVTGAYFLPSETSFWAISKDKGWRRSTFGTNKATWTWPEGFDLVEKVPWSSAPPVTGQRPHEEKGVTAAYYIGPKLFVVSVDKMWAYDGRSWVAAGTLQSMPGWKDAPPAGCD